MGMKKVVSACTRNPVSVYMGNICALNHNAAYDEDPTGTYGDGPPSQRVQTAVMLRSDVFRAARAREINAKPGLEELFTIVNRETARHIARQPLHLPDLAAVLAESTTCIATVFPSVAAATSTASAPVFPIGSIG